ncbi:MAG: glutaminyl-peptide cyclotransferase [Anaerolineae bacterium]|nr:glutaminyl-peptide cyclotransferase [Anaerolineae bacterium]
MQWIGKTQRLLSFVTLVIFLSACTVTVNETGKLGRISIDPPAVAYVRPQIISARFHDPSSYTQGLILVNGVFYESGGQYGESTLRKVDPQTGTVLQMISIPAQYFAEGLALVGDRLIQLTWKEQVAFIYDVNTFEKIGEYSYEGEGWGLCYDGEWLYMSNGSSNLTRRDPNSFEVKETIPVTLFDQPVSQLNELECVGNSVYANIYTTDQIVKIDKHSGRVSAYIETARMLNDGASLLTAEQANLMYQRQVLNGIAYDPEKDVFLITGKYWPVLFEVRLDER